MKRHGRADTLDVARFTLVIPLSSSLQFESIPNRHLVFAAYLLEIVHEVSKLQGERRRRIEKSGELEAVCLAGRF